jgi:signal transduction histidine kinase
MWAGSNTDIENTVQTKKRTEELVKSTLVLKRQRSQLIALSEAKDEFINLASHQLRTPATGVKQYVSMLLEGYAGTVTSSQREFLELANESNERQLKIIEDLLKVAQADSGHMHLDTTSTDLVPLIESVIEEQSLRFEERQQHVSFNHKEPSLNVLIDWDKIRMVLENLIDNASKYTHAGKSITVTLVRSKDDVQIAFKDEGVGIAEKQVSQLFQKFSRLSNDVSVLVGGSGLGLYLSKKIIDLHHGSITVTSVPGKGSTFTVIIPTDATNQRTT